MVQILFIHFKERILWPAERSIYYLEDVTDILNKQVIIIYFIT